MDKAIEYYFNAKIKKKTKLTGGLSFNTWILTLEDSRRLIFRSANSYMNTGGRYIDVSDIFRREKFFYDSINIKEQISPEVYVIDDSFTLYPEIFQIYEYIEGIPLDKCFDSLDDTEKSAVYYNIGATAAMINNIKIDAGNPYITQRGEWIPYISNRLKERLVPLIQNGLITMSEAEALKDGMEKFQSETLPLSFLHLDLRFCNMIYSNKKLYVIDAENSEFGDFYFEIARIENSGLLNNDFIKGYLNVSEIKSLNFSQDLYMYYKMESTALVVNVYLNEIFKNDNESRGYIRRLLELKETLLRRSI